MLKCSRMYDSSYFYYLQFCSIFNLVLPLMSGTPNYKYLPLMLFQYSSPFSSQASTHSCSGQQSKYLIFHLSNTVSLYTKGLAKHCYFWFWKSFTNASIIFAWCKNLNTATHTSSCLNSHPPSQVDSIHAVHSSTSRIWMPWKISDLLLTTSFLCPHLPSYAPKEHL